MFWYSRIAEIIFLPFSVIIYRCVFTIFFINPWPRKIRIFLVTADDSFFFKNRLAFSIYTVTKKFPLDERFGLTSQIRRASVSIPANIAEGFSKKTKTNKARFYNIAKSSLEEVRYYLILSGDLVYIENSNLLTQLEEISRLLHSYTKNLLNSDSWLLATCFLCKIIFLIQFILLFWSYP